MAISGSGHGDAVLRRALAEQTNQLYSHMPISMTGTIINGAILVYVLWNAVSRSVIIAWYATALVITFIRYLIWFAHKKTSPEHKNTIFWFRLQAIGIGAAGLVWGACSLLMFVPDSIVHQVFLAFIIAGMAAGGMASYAVRMDTFCLFAVPLLTPLAIAFFTARGSLPTLMGAMTVLLGLIITATAKRMSQTFTNSIELTMKNDDLLRSLKREKENAEAANKAKSKFLANMSHELRTPLNGITGLADLLSMTSQTEEQQEYTANIKQSSSVLCTLIGDILDFSKIEADKIRLENIEFSLRELLESVSDLFARNAFDRNLDFGCLIKDDVPDRLIGDSSRLRQILTNLISNAIKYTDTGEVAVYVSSEKKDGKTVRLHFRVEDTGIGISPEHQQQLFQPFTQVNASNNRLYGGTGLGLAISNQLVALMGGEAIQVSSRPRQGAAFFFTLPFGMAPAGSSDTTSDEPDQPSLNGVAVLMAGDNSITMKIIETYLRGRGCVLETTRDITTAQKLLQEGPPDRDSFDAVLVDITGDSIKAGGLVAQIHLSDNITRTAVILVSDKRGSHDAPEKQIPAEGHLIKPIKKDQLEQCLLKAIGQSSPGPDDGEASFSAAVTPGQKCLEEPGHDQNSGKSSLAILVAEDNPLNQRVIRMMLEKMGHAVTLVDNGREALRQYRHNAFDLILMDGQMPVMDGLEAARQIRQDEIQAETKQRIPIIAVTAHAIKGDREVFLEAGMDDYISKPIKQNALREIVQKWSARAATTP